MKTTGFGYGRASLVGALCLIALGITAAQGRAQGPMPYLAQALGRVAAAGAMMQLDSFDYDNGTSMLGIYLGAGQSHTIRTLLEAGVRYVVIGAADEDVLDLDLVARHSFGTVLARDVDTDPVALLDFTPRESGQVDIRITNYRATRAGFCAMVILRESPSGGRFDLSELTQALGNSMALARAAGLAWTQFAQGSFCVFGGRLAQRHDSGLFDISLPAGRYLALAAGSDSVSDVDLTVIRQHEHGNSAGAEVTRDSTVGSTALCRFEVENGQAFHIRHKNYETVGGRSGFVFTCLLKR